MKKILTIKHGSLGDIIMSLPAFASIRFHYKNSKIFLLTERKHVDFFTRCPFVDFVIEDNRKDNLFSTFKRLAKLVDENFNLIIDLQNSKRTTLYNIFFRFSHSVKISSSRSFAHYRYLIPQQGTESVVSGLFNQLKLIGIQRKEYQNFDWLKIDLKEKFDRPLALFIPGVSKSGSYKQWQTNKFADIAKHYEKLNYIICVVGTKEDKKSVSPIINLCKNVLNKIDQSPPEVIYSLALQAKIIFSNDTGPGHVASLAKKNFIWLVNDNKLSKANQPIGNHIYKIQAPSVKDISTKDVINFLEKNNLF